MPKTPVEAFNHGVQLMKRMEEQGKEWITLGEGVSKETAYIRWVSAGVGELLCQRMDEKGFAPFTSSCFCYRPLVAIREALVDHCIQFVLFPRKEPHKSTPLDFAIPFFTPEKRMEIHHRIVTIVQEEFLEQLKCLDAENDDFVFLALLSDRTMEREDMQRIIYRPCGHCYCVEHTTEISETVLGPTDIASPYEDVGLVVEIRCPQCKEKVTSTFLAIGVEFYHTSKLLSAWLQRTTLRCMPNNDCQLYPCRDPNLQLPVEALPVWMRYNQDRSKEFNLPDIWNDPVEWDRGSPPTEAPLLGGLHFITELAPMSSLLEGRK